MTTQPRQQMRDLIAENEGKRRNGPASDGRGWYRSQADRDDCYAVADAVLDLFPDVELAHEHRSPGLILPVAPYIPGQVRATHSLFVLRTAPSLLTTIEETPA